MLQARDLPGFEIANDTRAVAYAHASLLNHCSKARLHSQRAGLSSDVSLEYAMAVYTRWHSACERSRSWEAAGRRCETVHRYRTLIDCLYRDRIVSAVPL